VLQMYPLIPVELRDILILNQFIRVEGAGSDEGKMPKGRKDRSLVINATNNSEERRGISRRHLTDLVKDNHHILLRFLCIFGDSYQERFPGSTLCRQYNARVAVNETQLIQ